MDTPHDHRAERRLVMAGVAGNVMEWYDFAIYGYFAPVIGQHFFPSHDQTASLMAAFGVFAAGFLMRPLGGLVFGHIGDRIGRKPALTISVLAMAIPTFLIGILPGYQYIGALGALALVILRMIQGLSVGGEYTTSVVFLVEGAAPHRRGLAGSWSVFGAVAGILFGSAVGTLVTELFTSAQIDAWAWRLPFIGGLAVGVAGLYIRRHIPDPPVTAKGPTESPILAAFRTQWRTMIRIAGFNMLNAVGFYLAFVYVVTYFQEIDRVPSAQAFQINTINMAVLLVLIPTAGALADHVSPKWLLMGAAAGVVLLAYPLFWLMHHPTFALMLLGQMGFSILLGIYFGALPIAMVGAVPAHVRCCGLSIAYNLCLGVIGGTTPMVATFLIEKSADDLSPAYYMMFGAAVTLAFLWGFQIREFDAPAPAAVEL